MFHLPLFAPSAFSLSFLNCSNVLRKACSPSVARKSETQLNQHNLKTLVYESRHFSLRNGQFITLTLR